VERGKTTKARLLETATKLFADRGFAGTSIESVLEASGVSRGSLYHHFDAQAARPRRALSDARRTMSLLVDRLLR
jgi:AcrR family transcriptional regulator